MARKPGKSESLTIRLDPKTRFMLEFVARLRGQTITTVVERAIYDAASRAKIESEYNEPDMTWSDFWSLSEGERALRIASAPALMPTYDEEKRLAFAKEHWPFFYASSHKVAFHPVNVAILWPDIDDYIAEHEKFRAEDYHHAGQVMALVLKNAGLPTPKWPQPELEDVIPF